MMISENKNVTTEYAVEMKNIHKRFGGIIALSGVDIKIKKGEVHAILGENGAGKSTIMKVLAGNHIPEQGEIFLDGKKITIKNPKEALKHGISMIYQELNFVPEMTVADNVMLGKEPVNKLGLVDYKKMRSMTKDLIKTIGVDINPKTLMKNLTVAQIQLIEIAKAISEKPNIIIMDEPTSALSTNETETLFKIIKQFKEKGITTIYISHKMEEIVTVCDRVTILRDGKYMGTREISNLSVNELITLMVGRELKHRFPKVEAKIGEKILEVKNLSRKGKFKNVSFTLSRGEILGLAGLMGAGRTEVVETISGLYKSDGGEMFINGKKMRFSTPQQALRNGLFLVPEDRKAYGLVLCLSIKENILMSCIDKCKGAVCLNRKKETAVVSRMVDQLSIKAKRHTQLVEMLSGGNQQKVVIGKCLAADPDIIILDEPTRGIDVQTKADIYLLVSELAQMGKAIILISSEMPEILGLSDRVIVMHEGEITGELDRSEATQESILRYAMNLN